MGYIIWVKILCKYSKILIQKKYFIGIKGKFNKDIGLKKWKREW